MGVSSSGIPLEKGGPSVFSLCPNYRSSKEGSALSRSSQTLNDGVRRVRRDILPVTALLQEPLKRVPSREGKLWKEAGEIKSTRQEVGEEARFSDQSAVVTCVQLAEGAGGAGEQLLRLWSSRCFTHSR